MAPGDTGRGRSGPSDEQVDERAPVSVGRRWLVGSRLRRWLAVGVVAALVVGSCSYLRRSGDDGADGVRRDWDPDVFYVYDEVGRLAAVTDPEGETAAYSYDPVGNLTGVERFPTDDVSVLQVQPATAVPGEEVTVQGTGFTGDDALSVRIGGTEAELVESDRYEATVVVPDAVEPGRVEVEVSVDGAETAEPGRDDSRSGPGGSATGEVTVLVGREPVVEAVSATLVAPGDELVITGEGFTGDPLLDQVTVGRSYAAVVSASETELVVDVPPTATTGPVLVSTPYGNGRSHDRVSVVPVVDRPSLLARLSPEPVDPAIVGATAVASPAAEDDGEQNEPVDLELADDELGLVYFRGSARQRVALDVSGDVECRDLGVGLVAPGGVDLGAGDETIGDGQGAEEADGPDPLATWCGNETILPWDGWYTAVVEPTGSDGAASGSTVTVELTANGRAEVPERLDDVTLAEIEAERDPDGTSAGTEAPALVPRGEVSAGSGRMPVDLYSGAPMVSEVDLVLADVVPFELVRSYHPVGRPTEIPALEGAFGIGSTLDWDVELDVSLGNQYAVLDGFGAMTAGFRRVSEGTDREGALFEYTGAPGLFSGSTVRFNGHGWDVRLPDGLTLSFQGRELVGIGDGQGNRTVIERERERDGSGRVSSGNIAAVYAPTGRSVQFVWDDNDHIAEARSHSGHRAIYRYTDLPAQGAGAASYQGRQVVGGVEYQGPDGEVLGGFSYRYDDERRLAGIADQDGEVVVDLTYDEEGRVASQTVSGSETYEFAYDTEPAAVEDDEGEPHEMEVVAGVTVTYPDGLARRVGFENGWWLSDTWAVGTDDEVSWSSVRDAETGVVEAYVGPDGDRTQYRYDEDGTVVGVTAGAGTSDEVETRFLPDDSDPYLDLVGEVTEGDGAITTFGYDPIGRLTGQNLPGDREIGLDYDHHARVEAFTDPAGEQTTVVSEAAHRVTVVDPAGAETSDYFDAAGRLAASTDAAGHTTSYGYNDYDQLVSVTDPAGGESHYEYDEAGHLVGVTDPAGNTTRYRVDGEGRVTERTDPAGHSDTYAYDERGQIASQTDRRGFTTAYEYDTHGRPVLVTYGASDEAGGDGGADGSTVAYRYDAAGRLVEVDDSDHGVIELGYDGLGHLISETTPDGETTYEYDTVGRRTSMTLPDGTETTYDYDASGLLTGISQDGVEVAASRDDTGRVVDVDLPNEVTARYDYDPRGPPLGVTYRHDGDDLAVFDYHDGPTGQVAASRSDLGAVDLPDAVDPESVAYGANNELTGFDGEELTYDEAGNLVDDGTNSYTWDERGRLVGIDGETSASFEYDPFGRRTSATFDGATTAYRYDGHNPVQVEQTGRTETYVTGLGLDETYARVGDDGEVATFLADPQGTVHGSVGPDGELADRYSYTPHGVTSVGGPADPDGNGGDDAARGAAVPGEPGLLGFQGRELDPTGLYYQRARYYDPQSGRFISEDPLGLDAGDLNLYARTFGDPVNLTDPTGMQTAEAVGIGVCVGVGLGNIQAAGPRLEEMRQLFEDGMTGRIDEATYLIGLDRLMRENDDDLRRLFFACGALIDVLAFSSLARWGWRMLRPARPSFPNLRPVSRQPTPTSATPGVQPRPRPSMPDAPTSRPGRPPPGRPRPDGNPCSFSSDTEVLLADGESRRRISELRPGDRVLAADPDGRGEPEVAEPATVIATSRHDDILQELTTEDGGVVATTQDHPFWDVGAQGWVPAGDLEQGDSVLALDGRNLPVEGLDPPGPRRHAPAHNLTVSPHHTYFVAAGDSFLLASNSCSDRPARYGPFYRKQTSTQTPEDARMQVESGQLWGRAPQNGGDDPMVQAYAGHLPSGQRGIEFYTNVPPNRNGMPGEANWSGNRPGVQRFCEDFVAIDIVVTGNTQC